MSRLPFVKDFKGNKFKSVSDMCKCYGVLSATYRARVKKGASLEEALTNTSQGKDSVDHLGKQYRSIGEMLKAYRVSRDTYYKRIKNGCSLEEALTGNFKRKSYRSGKVCYDHLGNGYPSISVMCQVFNIPRDTYSKRIKKGYSVEEALTNIIIK